MRRQSVFPWLLIGIALGMLMGCSQKKPVETINPCLTTPICCGLEPTDENCEWCCEQMEQNQ